MKEGQPRFHPKVEVPVPPEGQIVVKFYGEPACIPDQAEGELLVGRTPFTMRQIEALKDLAKQRSKLEVIAVSSFPSEERIKGGFVVNLN